MKIKNRMSLRGVPLILSLSKDSGTTRQSPGRKWLREIASSSAIGGLLAMTTLLFLSCGSTNFQGEDYGNIMASEGGLALTAHEHKQGWGIADCNICHNTSNIHLVDRSDTGMDMAAIREQVTTEGLASCAICHGTNGVDGPTCASCH